MEEVLIIVNGKAVKCVKSEDKYFQDFTKTVELKFNVAVEEYKYVNEVALYRTIEEKNKLIEQLKKNNKELIENSYSSSFLNKYFSELKIDLEKYTLQEISSIITKANNFTRACISEIVRNELREDLKNLVIKYKEYLKTDEYKQLSKLDKDIYWAKMVTKFINLNENREN